MNKAMIIFKIFKKIKKSVIKKEMNRKNIQMKNHLNKIMNYKFKAT